MAIGLCEAVSERLGRLYVGERKKCLSVHGGLCEKVMKPWLSMSANANGCVTAKK